LNSKEDDLVAIAEANEIDITRELRTLNCLKLRISILGWAMFIRHNAFPNRCSRFVAGMSELKSFL
jgi:hypothetical protein